MKILADVFHEKSSIIRNKYGDLYHLNEKSEFIYHDFYVTEWSLFKKHKDINTYFSNKNQPILSSKNGNDLDDLESLIQALECKRVNKFRNLK